MVTVSTVMLIKYKSRKYILGGEKGTFLYVRAEPIEDKREMEHYIFNLKLLSGYGRLEPGQRCTKRGSTKPSSLVRESGTSL
jgi:hypothetical protein